MFIPSIYQTKIFEFITNGRGDAAVNAVAGSGKTRTLEEAAKLVKSDKALFLAFNKNIAEELARRLVGTSMIAKTVHSIGFSALAKDLGGTLKVDEDKYKTIAYDWLEHEGVAESKIYPLANDLSILCTHARQSCVNLKDHDALLEITDIFDLEIPEEYIEAVEPCLKKGARIAESRHVIDYTDMLWFPHKWELTPARMEWVFVDEAQDLSKLQSEVALSCRAPGGRMLFVGDPRQAIYAFAGADAFSFNNIVRRTNATELPLSVCYRCPTSHIDLAKQLVPQIEAAPNAVAGSVQHIAPDDIYKLAQEGDMVIGRKNVHLMSVCLRLIANKIPAKMRGRAIGKSITKIITALKKMPDYNYREFNRFLNAYEAKETERLEHHKRATAKLQELDDKVETLRLCHENFDARDENDLMAQIEELFSDERASVLCSSVHRAKGLEAKRVFIIHPECLPLVWKNQQSWELEQEMNLKYVALTRAKETLFIVDKDNSYKPQAIPAIIVTVEAPIILDPARALPALCSAPEPAGV